MLKKIQRVRAIIVNFLYPNMKLCKESKLLSSISESNRKLIRTKISIKLVLNLQKFTFYLQVA